MNPVARTREKVRSFHGWKVAASGATVWAFQSMIWTQGFGNLAVVLRDPVRGFGWSKTFISAAFSITRAEAAVLGVPLGMALKRYNIGTLMRIGAVIQMFGFLALSQVNGRAAFIAAVMVLTVGITLAGFLTIRGPAKPPRAKPIAP